MTELLVRNVRPDAGPPTDIRSHVDIDPDYGLSNLHGVLEAAERHRHLAGVEIVAFPQTGLRINPGTADLLEQALREGASIVGGIGPASTDGDPKGHLDTIFAIADRGEARIDLHLHEPGPLGLFELDLILERPNRNRQPLRGEVPSPWRSRAAAWSPATLTRRTGCRQPSRAAAWSGQRPFAEPPAWSSTSRPSRLSCATSSW